MWYPVPPAEGVDCSKHPNVKLMQKDIDSVSLWIKLIIIMYFLF